LKRKFSMKKCIAISRSSKLGINPEVAGVISAETYAAIDRLVIKYANFCISGPDVRVVTEIVIAVLTTNNVKVLVVEDHPTQVVMLVDVLREVGCSVEMAETYGEAAAKLGAGLFQLVVSDYDLGGTVEERENTGGKLLEKYNNPATHYFGISGDNSSNERLRALGAVCTFGKLQVMMLFRFAKAELEKLDDLGIVAALTCVEEIRGANPVVASKKTEGSADVEVAEGVTTEAAAADVVVAMQPVCCILS
jgi:CheY-like chemotaxis protein